LLIKLAGRKLIVTRMENSIEGFDAAYGKMLWHYDFTTEPYVHPNRLTQMVSYIALQDTAWEELC